MQHIVKRKPSNFSLNNIMRSPATKQIQKGLKFSKKKFIKFNKKSVNKLNLLKINKNKKNEVKTVYN